MTRLHNVQRNIDRYYPITMTQLPGAHHESMIRYEVTMIYDEGMIMAYLMVGVITGLLSAGLWQYLRLLK